MNTGPKELKQLTAKLGEFLSEDFSKQKFKKKDDHLVFTNPHFQEVHSTYVNLDDTPSTVTLNQFELAIEKGKENGVYFKKDTEIERVVENLKRKLK